MFKKKILLIEDSMLYAQKITSVLTQAGFEIVRTDNGDDGMRLVREIKPDLLLLDLVLPGINGFEVCRQLRASESNTMMPIIMLTSDDNQDHIIEGLELGADDYMTKPFNDRELAIRVKNTLLRFERLRNVNPLTGLPGNLDITREVEARIQLQELFSVIYADLDNFKAYNDIYGFANGDIAIKLTADILTDQVAMVHDETSFVGHVGGDDFVVVTKPQYHEKIAQGTILEFDKRIRELYTEADLQRGYICARNRQGEKTSFPIMTLSLAIVSNEKRIFHSSIQVAEVATEIKKMVKKLPGSNYFVDRRVDRKKE